MKILRRALTFHRTDSPRRAATRMAGLALAIGVLLGGCFSQTINRGYILPPGALEQIPIGASQEQVLIVLGTPSTVATVSGEAFYYISQTAQQSFQFMPPKVTDQRVTVVYFDKNRRVERLANYGLQDGRVFDYVTRTTQAAGRELNYLSYLFKIVGKE
jgi:outer membrane protein assembly factor BamE (lipoprotein component of BamABCDE complex)